ncbi:MAG: DnaD domain protein [Bacillota bacterium]
MFAKIKSFLEDGMEEEVIVEVMKYSQNQVSGNPFNYIVSILNDYVNQGILTLDEYNKLIARGEEHGGQVQRNNRTKKAGTQKPDLEELYRQGYR